MLYDLIFDFVVVVEFCLQSLPLPQDTYSLSLSLSLSLYVCLWKRTTEVTAGCSAKRFTLSSELSLIIIYCYCLRYGNI